MVGTEKRLERLDSINWDSKIGDILPRCSAIAADIWLERVWATSDRSGAGVKLDEDGSGKDFLFDST